MFGLNTMSIVVLVICLIVLFIVCYSVVISNKFNRLSVKVDEAKSSIEIALVKRYDVLKQSVECVKKYATHESEIFEKLIEVRKGMSLDQLQRAANQQADVLSKLVAVGESYPNLKSDTMFSNLQKQISEENEHLAAARRMFNGNVSSYNQLIVIFPASIIAGIKGCQEKEFFKDDEIETKKNISFDF